MKTFQNSSVRWGLVAGFSTGIFWGLPFLGPKFLPEFSAFEIAFGRFFFFGIVSLFFIRPVISMLRATPAADWWKLFLLSASGFWFYSIVLFWGISKTSGIIGSLILGLLPVSIPAFSRGTQGFPVKAKLGFGLILIGMIFLFGVPLISDRTSESVSWSGVLALMVCLGLWTAFAISNSRFLQARPHLSRKDFSSVMGIFSWVIMLFLFVPFTPILEFLSRETIWQYLGFSLMLGFGSSWLANWLWNICSFRCPPALSGPLLASETLFGLIYSFAIEKRGPVWNESLAIGLTMFGVILAVFGQTGEKHD